MKENNIHVRKITTKSTSSHSWEVIQPIIINELPTTRRVFLAIINDAKTTNQETVSGTIIHQRKKAKDNWEPAESINLTTLRGGEGVKIPLDSEQTRRLYDGLTQLYALSQKGIKHGKKDYVIAEINKIIEIPQERIKFITSLLERNHGEEFWSELINNDPDLATRLSLARIHMQRTKALGEFEHNLKNQDKDEAYWQDFFYNNQWIFGYGLKYQFLNLITDQPNYGGMQIYGKGNQKGDFLLNTEAEVKFTVLVEIKTPNKHLISKERDGSDKKYRNGAWLLGPELLGGISQLQMNCKTWQRKSVEPENSDLLSPQKIHTINPKGLLVIGHTAQFKNNREKIETFECFRRSIYNPEIITFDELFERAKFIVNNQATVDTD